MSKMTYDDYTDVAAFLTRYMARFLTRYMARHPAGKAL